MCFGMGGGQTATPTGGTELPKATTPAPVIPVKPAEEPAPKSSAASTDTTVKAPTTSANTGLNIPS